jgi:hypothetical protein
VAETCKDLSVAGFRVILNLGGCRGIGTKEEVERSVEILIHDYKVIPVNSYLDIEVIDLIDR